MARLARRGGHSGLYTERDLVDSEHGPAVPASNVVQSPKSPPAPGTPRRQKRPSLRTTPQPAKPFLTGLLPIIAGALARPAAPRPRDRPMRAARPGLVAFPGAAHTADGGGDPLIRHVLRAGPARSAHSVRWPGGHFVCRWRAVCTADMGVACRRRADDPRALVACAAPRRPGCALAGWCGQFGCRQTGRENRVGVADPAGVRPGERGQL